MIVEPDPACPECHGLGRVLGTRQRLRCDDTVVSECAGWRECPKCYSAGRVVGSPAFVGAVQELAAKLAAKDAATAHGDETKRGR